MSSISKFKASDIKEDSLYDMDETRTVKYQHVEVQYAHPALVIANYKFQDRLYEKIMSEKLNQKRKKIGLLKRIFHS